jgi:hypothetical protein
MTTIKWFAHDDGGRAAAGYKGFAGDCGARALAIVAGIPYQEAYDLVNEAAAVERPGARKRRRSGAARPRSSARTGVYGDTMRRLMAKLGWTWVPTMRIGSGCTVHLKADELPAGRLLVNVSKHYTAVIDGVIHDTHDPSRDGTRCVYGYWVKR